MNNKHVKLGSVVWDKDSSDWFQVQNSEVLDLVNKNWEARFTGIPLTENYISSFFSDLEPSYESESRIKYKLFKERQMGKCMATFYGFFTHKDDPYFISNPLSAKHNCVIQFNAGNDPFNGFYKLKNNKRTYVKYVHELQNIIE